MSQHNIPVFKANLIIRGKIEAKTGLHIGGSNENLQIGGVDMVVVRDPRTQHPYIPGSSLKGKMRHLLEYITGAVNNPLDGKIGGVSIDKEIVSLFGIGADVLDVALRDKEHDKRLKSIADKQKKGKTSQEDIDNELASIKYIRKNYTDIGLPKLIVRDALPDEETVGMWSELGSDANFTEYKAENTIDRLTSAANPRFAERVVQGSKFNFEIVYTAYGDDIERINNEVSNILLALRLLENNTLGKSGTRGYGKVRFHLAKPIWLTADDYRQASQAYKNSREEELAVSDQELAGFTDDFKYPENTSADA